MPKAANLSNAIAAELGFASPASAGHSEKGDRGVKAAVVDATGHILAGAAVAATADGRPASEESSLSKSQMPTRRVLRREQDTPPSSFMVKEEGEEEDEDEEDDFEDEEKIEAVIRAERLRQRASRAEGLLAAGGSRLEAGSSLLDKASAGEDDEEDELEDKEKIEAVIRAERLRQQQRIAERRGAVRLEAGSSLLEEASGGEAEEGASVEERASGEMQDETQMRRRTTVEVQTKKLAFSVCDNQDQFRRRRRCHPLPLRHPATERSAPLGYCWPCPAGKS